MGSFDDTRDNAKHDAPPKPPCYEESAGQQAAPSEQQGQPAQQAQEPFQAQQPYAAVPPYATPYAQQPYSQQPYAAASPYAPPYGQQPYVATPPYAQQPYAQQPYAQQPYTAVPPYAQQPYAQQPYATPPYVQQPFAASSYVQPVVTKDHVAAGLLAIFLGVFGVHKFYLGYNTPGFIMLAITILGGLFTFGLAAGVMWVISLVEGIIYLAKTQSEFDIVYVANKKEWF